ncbi:MAG: TlpA family protein disulfide reductase [Bdellovibrionales bacterium]|nr:TlpA family protein disulfide reductase [Bdellovibrionales bacterium]
MNLRIFVLVFLSFGFIHSSLANFKCEGSKGNKVGDCAFDFTLPNLNGNSTRLSQYAGQVIFLNFWATWCAPCADEIPWMETVLHKMENRKFAMITVSIDREGPVKIKNYFNTLFKHEPLFPVLLDSEKTVSTRFGTFKVPETFIIDKTGKIRDKVEGIKNWSDPMIVHYMELLTTL